MSKYYIKDYKENQSSLLYSKRILYSVEIAEPEYENLFNFYFAEKQLYGRVTRVFEPMTVASSTQLKAVPAVDGMVRPQKVLPFVADAFNQMAQQFQKKAMIGEIDTEDKYLSNLVVYKSYENPQQLYNEHFKLYTTALETVFKSKRTPVSNFDEMIGALLTYLEKAARKNPFTMTAFVKSTFCPISVSGLAIEIGDAEYINDEDKINLFKKSNNWKFYLNACKTYGFMVDSNIPWRLIADIGSGQMVRYATAYNLLSTDDILNTQYTKVAAPYVEQFKYGLYSLYETVKGPTYTTERCPNGTLKVNRVEPKHYTVENFSKQFSEQYFLKLYFKVRFMEEESQFTANEQFQLIDDCLEIARMNMSRGVNIFERILNKTFDYNGSLDYIIRRLRQNPSTDADTLLPNY